MMLEERKGPSEGADIRARKSKRMTAAERQSSRRRTRLLGSDNNNNRAGLQQAVAVAVGSGQWYYSTGIHAVGAGQSIAPSSSMPATFLFGGKFFLFFSFLFFSSLLSFCAAVTGLWVGSSGVRME